MKHKTIEPFVIEIEKRTGIVSHLKNDDKVHEYTHSIAIRDYFIKKYLDARETFDGNNSEYFYKKVVASLSAPDVYRQFNYLIRSNDKSSPISLFTGADSNIVQIISISELKQNTLQVRFIVEGRFPSGTIVKINRIAIIEYSFYNFDMSEEMRYINPLGFTITSYKVSNEVL